jgi:ParB-like chromosome segregation protein Spo0J
MAFEPRGVSIPIAQILPTRTISPDTRNAPQYLRLQASIKEIGLVEPLVVHPQADTDGGSENRKFYTLLDGHTRYDILKIRGDDRAFCLIARDDEAFTYNHKVNQIPRSKSTS